MKKIVLTGGGTAGHVMPNLALIPELKDDWEIYYIGSETGMEREIIRQAGIAYYPIATGKLRRYLSLKNLTDPFLVIKGLTQAYLLLRKLRPEIVFSKGGFVSVPVVIGAWLNRIPVILHESDLTPGLANRLSLPFAKTICATFPETIAHLPAKKGLLTGNPIRKELFTGIKGEGLSICGFTREKPVLLVIGGSLGSAKINRLIRSVLPDLLTTFQVAHICGKGHIDRELENKKGYAQFEFVSAELPSILSAADICLSRAGANFIFELLTLKKPTLLIPLSKEASRGDQILNARSFEKQGFSLVLMEEEVTGELLLRKIKELYTNRSSFITNMEKSGQRNATTEVVKLINSLANNKEH